MAAGAVAGTAELHTSLEADGSASLDPRGGSFFANRTYASISTPVISLSDFIREKGIEFVDFVKFDIEGREMAALEGLKDSLAEEGSVGALAFEFGSANLNSRTSFRDFWAMCLDYPTPATAAGKDPRISKRNVFASRNLRHRATGFSVWCPSTSMKKR